MIISLYSTKNFTYSASIAQLVEHFTRNEGVEGSSPFFSFLKSLDFQGFFHFLHSESRPFLSGFF